MCNEYLIKIIAFNNFRLCFAMQSNELLQSIWLTKTRFKIVIYSSLAMHDHHLLKIFYLRGCEIARLREILLPYFRDSFAHLIFNLWKVQFFCEKHLFTRNFLVTCYRKQREKSVPTWDLDYEERTRPITNKGKIKVSLW